MTNSTPNKPTNCITCGKEIPLARLQALPNTSQCIECIRDAGDVDLTEGYMSWEHKTAPVLITGPLTRILRRYSRRGPHAQLPLSSPKNPRIAQSVQAAENFRQTADLVRSNGALQTNVPEKRTVINTPRARCHPNRPRVTSDGKCLDCAITWYNKRRIR